MHVMPDKLSQARAASKKSGGGVMALLGAGFSIFLMQLG